MNIVLITLSLILTAKSIVKKHIEPYVLITLCFILTNPFIRDAYLVK